jgi:ABC-type amino acid transport substrate-binding protein
MEGMPVMSSAVAKFMGVLLRATVFVAAGVHADETPGGTLDRIRQQKTIRIAYREDAPPFSYKGSAGEAAGLIVDLCKAVAANLTKQLNLSSLNVAYVSVTASDRFAAIQQHKADLLCEATSATLSRRGLVDFSIATYVDGASLMIRPDVPHNLQELAGRTVGP